MDRWSRQHQVARDVLREIRDAAGLRQRDLAERLDTSQSRVSAIERGERALDLQQIERYCNACGVTLRSFIRRYLKARPAPAELRWVPRRARPR